VPYKDLEIRKAKARTYTATYRARMKENKVLQPRVCLLCETDISAKRQDAKFCCRKHKAMFSDSNRNYAEQYAKNRDKKRDAALKYYYADVEKSRQKARDRQRQNLPIFAFNQAKRRSSKLQRTPSWLSSEDFWLIDEIYKLSALRTKLTGVKWHVDHIVPLRGNNVSGLHVPSNLQVILGQDNISKHNRFEAN
jgi:5-methylcytosine-specific restriction endonuclease McrA